MPGIYAAGDVTGVFQLASVAAMQGRIAMWHALGEAVAPIKLKTVAANVFTHPEIATVGVQEKTITDDQDIDVVRLPLATNARAKMSDLRDGFVKLFTRRSTGVVIGGVVVAPGASELVLPIALAVTKGLTAADLANTFSIYPSLSGSITEAGRRLMGSTSCPDGTAGGAAPTAPDVTGVPLNPSDRCRRARGPPMQKQMPSVRFAPAPRLCCARSRWVPRSLSPSVRARRRAGRRADRRDRRRPAGAGLAGDRGGSSEPSGRSAGCRARTARPSGFPPRTSRASRPGDRAGHRGRGGRRRRDPMHDVVDAKVVAAAPADPVLRSAAGLTNQVTVVRVAPGGVAPDGVTVQQLVDVVDGQVADFWSEQSNGADLGRRHRQHPQLGAPAAGCAEPDGHVERGRRGRSGSCPARAGT